jgi:hypothetical protein
MLEINELSVASLTKQSERRLPVAACISLSNKNVAACIWMLIDQGHRKLYLTICVEIGIQLVAC